MSFEPVGPSDLGSQMGFISQTNYIRETITSMTKRKLKQTPKLCTRCYDLQLI